MANKNNITKATLLTSGLSTLGIVGGVVFAVKRKSGFWGGLGWAIVGSMAGGGIGYVISSFMNFEDDKQNYNPSTSDDDYLNRFTFLSSIPSDKFTEENQNEWLYLMDKFTEENQNEWLYLMDKF